MLLWEEEGIHLDLYDLELLQIAEVNNYLPHYLEKDHLGDYHHHYQVCQGQELKCRHHYLVNHQ